MSVADLEVEIGRPMLHWCWQGTGTMVKDILRGALQPRRMTGSPGLLDCIDEQAVKEEE